MFWAATKMLKKKVEIRNKAVVDHGSLIWDRSGKDRQVKDALHDWFLFVKLWNTPVNSSVFCQKIEQLPKESGHLEFKVTNRWFTTWKK